MKMIQIIFRIGGVALLVLLCIYLINNAKPTNYYPITVSIELKSNENEKIC